MDSIEVNVLEKKVTLTCRYPIVAKVSTTRQVSAIHRKSLNKVAIFRRIFTSSWSWLYIRKFKFSSNMSRGFFFFFLFLTFSSWLSMYITLPYLHFNEYNSYIYIYYVGKKKRDRWLKIFCNVNLCEQERDAECCMWWMQNHGIYMKGCFSFPKKQTILAVKLRNIYKLIIINKIPINPLAIYKSESDSKMKGNNFHETIQR